MEWRRTKNRKEAFASGITDKSELNSTTPPRTESKIECERTETVPLKPDKYWSIACEIPGE
jgi:hypothetical protein